MKNNEIIGNTKLTTMYKTHFKGSFLGGLGDLKRDFYDGSYEDKYLSTK